MILRGNLVINVPCIGFATFSVSLPPSPTKAFSNNLLHKLLVFKSFISRSALRESNLRQLVPERDLKSKLWGLDFAFGSFASEMPIKNPVAGDK